MENSLPGSPVPLTSIDLPVLRQEEQPVWTASEYLRDQRKKTWRRFVPALVLLAVVIFVATLALMSTETLVAAPPVTRVSKVAEYPHDSRAFSQGLVFHKGELLEGTGRYRQSSLRRVNIGTGGVTAHVRLEKNVFGEGVTVWNDRIIQLTWENGYLIIYDADTLVRQEIVRYREIDASLKQGWGITYDGEFLIVSDGTAVLRFIDPKKWRVVRKLRIRSGIRSISKLNELEYVDGEILANVWYSSRIARIDPRSGTVIGWLELKGLFPRAIRRNREAVLNGIAWDATERRLYVTGKLWPSLFEITWDGLSGGDRRQKLKTD